MSDESENIAPQANDNIAYSARGKFARHHRSPFSTRPRDSQRNSRLDEQKQQASDLLGRIERSRFVIEALMRKASSPHTLEILRKTCDKLAVQAQHIISKFGAPNLSPHDEDHPEAHLEAELHHLDTHGHFSTELDHELHAIYTQYDHLLHLRDDRHAFSRTAHVHLGATQPNQLQQAIQR